MQALNDFVVVATKSRLDEDLIAQIKSSGGGAMIGCTNRLLFGHKNDFKNFPQDNGYEILQGAEAYAHILQVTLGLHGRTRGEAQIVGQIKDAWQEMEANHPARFQSLLPVFQGLMADNAMIRSNISHNLSPAYYERIAKVTANPSGGERILIVGDIHHKGRELSDVTTNLLMQLGSKGANQVGQVVLTHPDDSLLQRFIIPLTASRLRRKTGLGDRLVVKPFEQAIDSQGDLLYTDQMFVTYPMNKDPAVDRRIHDEWQQKEAFGGLLTHLGGPTKPHRKTAGIWLEHNLEGYIGPETITRNQELAKARNAYLIERAKQATYICAFIRSTTGRRPSMPMITSLIDKFDGLNPYAAHTLRDTGDTPEL